MRLPRFRFHQPGSAAEAKELLGELGPGARPLAGGTDLLVHLKKGLYPVDHVVDIAGLEELNYLSSGDRLDIGPLAPAAALAAWDAPGAVALAEAAAGLGTPVIRNRATIGGNLATARPAADIAVPLLAMGGRLVLSGPRGDRTAPLAEFFTGPGQTIKAVDELIIAVQAPAATDGAGAAFIKLGARRALEIAIVNLAAFIRLDRDGVIAEARAAMGAVGPTPRLAPSAAEALTGAKPGGDDDPVFLRAAKAAAGDASPIDDFRGSAGYRRMMVETLMRRALVKAWRRAQGDK